MNCQTISLIHTPSKLYKIRKKIPPKTGSYKKFKIAKKITFPEGFPKPLSCEEDFVLEFKNNPQEFLSPLSVYYNFPGIGHEVHHLHCFSQETLQFKSLIGPSEIFKSSAQAKMPETSREMENKSLIQMRKKKDKILQNQHTKMITNMKITKNCKDNIFENLHKQRITYRNKINGGIKLKIISTKKKHIKSMSEANLLI